jgi:hypothetical protein
MRIAIASSGLGHVARGIETWALDTAWAVAEVSGQESGIRSQGAGDRGQIEVTLFASAGFRDQGPARARRSRRFAPDAAHGRPITDHRSLITDHRSLITDHRSPSSSTPIPRHSDTPTLIALPCLRRGDRLARFLARAMPGWTWRWGLKSAYGWEQFSFWIRLGRHLKEGGYDILHVQDPMLAYWCKRDREKGRLKTQEILAHGTEEPIEFLAQFPCVQHLAPWHLEQALGQRGGNHETRERHENGNGDSV